MMSVGLPTTFSVTKKMAGSSKQYPILSLAGNPVSAWVMTHILLKPLVHGMLTDFTAYSNASSQSHSHSIVHLSYLLSHICFCLTSLTPCSY